MPIFYTDSGSFNNLEVTGSTILSGSSNVLTIKGSGSVILTVSGSQGPLFTINDNFSSTELFAVSSGSIDVLTVSNTKVVSVSGSLIVTGSITGSLLGTSSYALTAQTLLGSVTSASYAATASLADSSSYSLTSSYASFAELADIIVAAGGSTNNVVSNLVFSNSNNVSFGLNGATITATATFAAGGTPKSYFDNGIVFASAQSTAVTLGGSSNHVQPFVLPYDVSISYLRMPISVAITSNTIATTANTTINFAQTQTFWANIYSAGTGASSRTLRQIAQASATMVYAITAQEAANSNQQTVSHAFTYPSEGTGSSTFATNYSPAAASFNFSTTHLTAFTGFRFLDLPFATSLAAGNYWIAIQRASATAQTGATALSLLTNNFSYVGMSQVSQNMNIMGGNTTAGSNGYQLGLGFWTTNSNGTTSNSLNIAQISTAANQPRFPFQFIRQA